MCCVVSGGIERGYVVTSVFIQWISVTHSPGYARSRDRPHGDAASDENTVPYNDVAAAL